MKPILAAGDNHIDHLPAPQDEDEVEAVHGEKLVDDAVEEELPPTGPKPKPESDPAPPSKPASRP